MDLPLAVDAMGGDDAPATVVAGAVRAHRELGIRSILVGLPDALAPLDIGELEVHPCTEVIDMHDEPGAAVRRKKDSSLVRCAELVRDGKASAMVSGGNTGAAMASALLRLGRIKGVSRPAIVVALPKPNSAPTVLLDCGANATVQATWLAQFAQMGAAYAAERFGVADPRVGLLTIGEEAGKGNDLVKEAGPVLSETHGIRYVGNVEGRDLLNGSVDVVVTDGFTGNIAAKSLEGCFAHMKQWTTDVLGELPPSVAELYDYLDPETYGGAMLLGIDGVCVISHGSASERAIATGLGIARDLVDGGLVGHLRDAISA